MCFPEPGPTAHGGRQSPGDADLRLQEEDCRSGDEAEAAAESLRGRPLRQELVQQEPH